MISATESGLEVTPCTAYFPYRCSTLINVVNAFQVKDGFENGKLRAGQGFGEEVLFEGFVFELLANFLEASWPWIRAWITERKVDSVSFRSFDGFAIRWISRGEKY